jgi:hypothetical protein
MALNTVVFLRDRNSERDFDLSRLEVSRSDEVNRRLEYLMAADR